MRSLLVESLLPVNFHFVVGDRVDRIGAIAALIASVVGLLLITVGVLPLFFVDGACKRVKLPATLLLSTQFETPFNLDLIHAALFLFSVDIACWYKYALVSVFSCFGNLSKSLPALRNLNYSIGDAMLVEGGTSLEHRIRDVLLVGRAHTKSQNFHTIVVDLVFLAHN